MSNFTLPDLDSIQEPSFAFDPRVENAVQKELKYWPPTLAILVATASFVGGYAICWYYNTGGNVIAHWIAIAVFVHGFKHILGMWIGWSQQRAATLIKGVDKFERMNEKEIAKLEKQLGKQDKPIKKGRTDFDQDDFDDSAKAMLTKPVLEARKANAKVTGKGLIDTILKSFR